MGESPTLRGAVLFCPELSVTFSVNSAIVAPQIAERSAVTRPVALILGLETVTPLTVALAALLTKSESVLSGWPPELTVAMENERGVGMAGNPVGSFSRLTTTGRGAISKLDTSRLAVNRLPFQSRYLISALSKLCFGSLALVWRKPAPARPANQS
jgi:hypothetical protein